MLCTRLTRQGSRHSDAEQFTPGRWTAAFAKELPKHLYAPFGAGPRICIGNFFALTEMSVLLAELIRHFEFSQPAPAPLEFQASITARPRRPVHLQVRRVFGGTPR